MNRLLPTTLRGRLILLILMALAVAQALSLWLFVDERSAAIRTALALEAAERAANVTLLLEDTPKGQHAGILRAANSPLVRFTVDNIPAANGEVRAEEVALIERMLGLLGSDSAHEVRLELRGVDAPIPPMPGMPAGMMYMHKTMNMGHMSTTEMRISIRLATGGWLNVVTRFRNPAYQWARPVAATFLVTAALLVLVSWLALGRLIRPLRTLATYAERFGRGEAVAPLRPAGPVELQELSRAFNDMQERISRFVAERTRLLGAIGHDLRSPLTALRVRAEMVDDEETRTRMIAIIQEMQDMVEATLTFARGMAASEKRIDVDIPKLLEQLALEAAETGENASFTGAPAISLCLRQNALRRALRNVVENAIRYGGSARIGAEQDGKTLVIQVVDDGPGLPPDQLERVFDPFVRLEASRSRDTGGTGLGLSIARTIVRAQGGNITLENRAEGGLRALIRLPYKEQAGS